MSSQPSKTDTKHADPLAAPAPVVGTVDVGDTRVAAVRTDKGWVLAQQVAGQAQQEAAPAAVAPMLVVDFSPSMKHAGFWEPAVRAVQRTAARLHALGGGGSAHGGAVTFSTRSEAATLHSLRDKARCRELAVSCGAGATAPVEAFQRMIRDLIPQVPVGAWIPVTFLTDGEFNTLRGSWVGAPSDFDGVWPVVARELRQACAHRKASCAVHCVGLRDDSLEQIRTMAEGFAAAEVPFTYATIAEAREVAGAFTTAAELGFRHSAAAQAVDVPWDTAAAAAADDDADGAPVVSVPPPGSAAVRQGDGAPAGLRPVASLLAAFPPPCELPRAAAEQYAALGHRAAGLVAAWGPAVTALTARLDAGETATSAEVVAAATAVATDAAAVHAEAEAQWRALREAAVELRASLAALGGGAEAEGSGDDLDAGLVLPLFDAVAGLHEELAALAARVAALTAPAASEKRVYETYRAARCQDADVRAVLTRRQDYDAVTGPTDTGAPVVEVSPSSADDGEAAGLEVVVRHASLPTTLTVSVAGVAALEAALGTVRGGWGSVEAQAALLGVKIVVHSPRLPHSDMAPGELDVTVLDPALQTVAAFRKHHHDHFLPLAVHPAFAALTGAAQRRLSLMLNDDERCFSARHIRVYAAVLKPAFRALAAAAKAGDPTGEVRAAGVLHAALRTLRVLWERNEYAFVERQLPLRVADLVAMLARGTVARSVFRSGWEALAVVLIAAEADIAAAFAQLPRFPSAAAVYDAALGTALRLLAVYAVPSCPRRRGALASVVDGGVPPAKRCEVLAATAVPTGRAASEALLVGHPMRVDFAALVPGSEDPDAQAAAEMAALLPLVCRFARGPVGRRVAAGVDVWAQPPEAGAVFDGAEVPEGDVRELLADAALAAGLRRHQRVLDSARDKAVAHFGAQRRLHVAVGERPVLGAALEAEWFRDAVCPPTALTEAQCAAVNALFAKAHAAGVAQRGEAPNTLLPAHVQCRATAGGVLGFDAGSPEAFSVALCAALPRSAVALVRLARERSLPEGAVPQGALFAELHAALLQFPASSVPALTLTPRSGLPSNALALPGAPLYLVPLARRVLRRHLTRFHAAAAAPVRPPAGAYAHTTVPGLSTLRAFFDAAETKEGRVVAFMARYAPRLPTSAEERAAVEPAVRLYAAELHDAFAPSS